MPQSKANTSQLPQAGERGDGCFCRMNPEQTWGCKTAAAAAKLLLTPRPISVTTGRKLNYPTSTPKKTQSSADPKHFLHWTHSDVSRKGKKWTTLKNAEARKPAERSIRGSSPSSLLLYLNSLGIHLNGWNQNNTAGGSSVGGVLLFLPFFFLLFLFPFLSLPFAFPSFILSLPFSSLFLSLPFSFSHPSLYKGTPPSSKWAGKSDIHRARLRKIK